MKTKITDSEKDWKQFITKLTAAALTAVLCMASLAGCQDSSEPKRNTDVYENSSTPAPAPDTYTNTPEPEPTESKTPIGQVTGTGQMLYSELPELFGTKFAFTHDWLMENANEGWEQAIGYNGAHKPLDEYFETEDCRIGTKSSHGRFVEMEATEDNPLYDKGLWRIYVYAGFPEAEDMSPKIAFEHDQLFYRCFYDNKPEKAAGVPDGTENEKQWIYDNWGEPTYIENVNVGQTWVYRYEYMTIAVSYNSLASEKIWYIDIMHNDVYDAWLEELR